LLNAYILSSRHNISS